MEQQSGPQWSLGRGVAVVGVIAALIATWVYVADAGSSRADEGEETAVLTQVSASSQVEYRLTGSAAGADLTFTDGREQISQAAGKAVPLVTADGGGIDFMAARGTSLYLSAQNTGDAGDLTCQIVVDGVVVAENTSSGGYTIVTCQATA
ncbi:MmpS family transport accessory protein [Streptomyces sp. NPDC055025]